MNYISTRGNAQSVSASQAVINGIAPDGGLYVPESFPALDLDFDRLKDLSYQEIANEIFSAFFTDYTEEEIAAIVAGSYGEQWDDDTIVPIHQEGNKFYLELFHGPTIAFKDIALQALPRLLSTAAKKHGLKSKLLILAATSGDTGTAAMAGFGDVPGTEIVVFYPEVGVSEIQKQQMITEAAKNAHVIAITGNFDDAQTAVKTLFADDELGKELAAGKFQFSSANSINIGRLIPQIVYYIYGYAQLVKSGAIKAGDEIDIVVPTGNFGNIMASYYASRIGLPVREFIVASNENNVLTDFFNTGVYDRKRPFTVSTSPAMDILVSSNLERLLYFASDATEVANYMEDLTEKGSYTVSPEVRENLAKFKAGFASNEEVAATIKEVFEDTHYLLDPHTAVARFVAPSFDDGTVQLIASTASPFKFPQTVLEVLGESAKHERVALDQLALISGVPVPEQVAKLFTKEVRHTLVIDPEEIKETLKETIL
ncbi:MAG: threonine synthase [Lactobacillales bacterium]|jgi:threonine synthase|nr:threonine synthase [Lactobacillales bacterium]